MEEVNLRTDGHLGVVPVLPTPFRMDEEFDATALRRLVDFAVSAGVNAICLPAYGSEFYKLSEHERGCVVEIAVRQAAGRLAVVAQSTHDSSRLALSMARTYLQAGANLIAVGIPRKFPLPDDDLMRYLVPLLNGVHAPCIVQDYTPAGGPSLVAEFVARLRQECPNFRYLKLEHPLMADKVRAIREATEDHVGILEGWGGLYMMELIPAGISGIMPGLAMADLFSHIVMLRKEGQAGEAFRLFERVLPQVVFSLQNFELFLYCEKRLLQARGILSNAHCRSASYTPDPFTVAYVDELNQRILHVIDEVQLPSYATTRS